MRCGVSSRMAGHAPSPAQAPLAARGVACPPLLFLQHHPTPNVLRPLQRSKKPEQFIASRGERSRWRRPRCPHHSRQNSSSSAEERGAVGGVTLPASFASELQDVPHTHAHTTPSSPCSPLIWQRHAEGRRPHRPGPTTRHCAHTALATSPSPAERRCSDDLETFVRRPHTAQHAARTTAHSTALLPPALFPNGQLIFFAPRRSAQFRASPGTRSCCSQTHAGEGGAPPAIPSPPPPRPRVRRKEWEDAGTHASSVAQAQSGPKSTGRPGAGGRGPVHLAPLPSAAQGTTTGPLLVTRTQARRCARHTTPIPGAKPAPQCGRHSGKCSRKPG